MTREAILNTILPDTPFHLWVPALTHYCEYGEGVRIDESRMLAHGREMARDVKLWMLAGTTGDGWDLSDGQVERLLQLALSDEFRSLGARVLMGALRPATDEALGLVERIRSVLGLRDGASMEARVQALAERGLAGITICPPVGEGVSQDEIYRHVARVCAEGGLPVVVYQLPQVTGNRIEPATLAALVAEHESIVLFKDSSGEDEVARSGRAWPMPLLRGAEGDYIRQLKELGGSYDGWLLSSGNAFGPRLRRMADFAGAGRFEEAVRIAETLTALMDRLFEAVGDAPSGNAFSNANRAVDHLRAGGPRWAESPPPLLRDGTRLPRRILERTAQLLAEAEAFPNEGYLEGGRG